VAFPPSVVIDQTVIEPTLTVDSPLAPGHYSWTVRALAGDDTVLAELNRTFLVKDAINLVAPAVGEQIGPDILLQWQSYPGAVSYQVIVIDDAAYPPKVASDLATTETSLALPAPLKPGSYSWTVWAFDENQQLVAELTGSFVVTDSD
jgi:hypothetical protein